LSAHDIQSVLQLLLAAQDKRLRVVEEQQRVTARRLARLEQDRDLDAEPAAGGWERRHKYAARKGDSLSTVDRDIRRGLLEKKIEGRRVYVRPARRPPKPTPRRDCAADAASRGDEGTGGALAAAEDLRWPLPPLKQKEPCD
jgi:hypothetical protein